MVKSVIAECLGTGLFFTCILSWGEPIPVAAGLLAAVYAFGKTSGGHFNSAVSVMMYFKGDLDFPSLVAYIAAQLAGAALALIWWNNTLKTKKR